MTSDPSELDKDPERLSKGDDSLANSLLDAWNAPPDPTARELQDLERGVLENIAPKPPMPWKAGGALAVSALVLGLVGAAFMHFEGAKDSDTRPSGVPNSAGAPRAMSAQPSITSPSSTSPSIPSPSAASLSDKAPESQPTSVENDPSRSGTRTATKGTSHPVLPSSAAPVVAPPTASAVAVDTLRDENILLKAARSELERAPESALLRLSEHRRRFPKGELSPEREYLTIRALVGAGRKDEARELAKTFGGRFPDSPYLAPVESIRKELP